MSQTCRASFIVQTYRISGVSIFAARQQDFKDASVEAHVMGGDKICAEKQVPNSGPQHFESGLSLNLLPGDAMYGRKEEGASRRADQVIRVFVELSG